MLCRFGISVAWGLHSEGACPWILLLRFLPTMDTQQTTKYESVLLSSPNDQRVRRAGRAWLQ